MSFATVQPQHNVTDLSVSIKKEGVILDPLDHKVTIVVGSALEAKEELEEGWESLNPELPPKVDLMKKETVQPLGWRDWFLSYLSLQPQKPLSSESTHLDLEPTEKILKEEKKVGDANELVAQDLIEEDLPLIQKKFPLPEIDVTQSTKLALEPTEKILKKEIEDSQKEEVEGVDQNELRLSLIVEEDSQPMIFPPYVDELPFDIKSYICDQYPQLSLDDTRIEEIRTQILEIEPNWSSFSDAVESILPFYFSPRSENYDITLPRQLIQKLPILKSAFNVFQKTLLIYNQSKITSEFALSVASLFLECKSQPLVNRLLLAHSVSEPEMKKVIFLTKAVEGINLNETRKLIIQLAFSWDFNPGYKETVFKTSHNMKNLSEKLSRSSGGYLTNNDVMNVIGGLLESSSYSQLRDSNVFNRFITLLTKALPKNIHEVEDLCKLLCSYSTRSKLNEYVDTLGDVDLKYLLILLIVLGDHTNWKGKPQSSLFGSITEAENNSLALFRNSKIVKSLSNLEKARSVIREVLFIQFNSR